MPEMPEFVVQAELATGLPWWCLLLLAALVLVVLILAICLGREKRHNRIGAVDIPKGGAKAVPADDKDEDESAAGEIAADDARPEEPVGQNEDADANGEAEDAVAADSADTAELPETPMQEDARDGDDSEEAERPETTEPIGASLEDESAESDDDDERLADDAAAESPDVEVVEQARVKAAAQTLSDDEILKAASGNHSRRGQSAFGVDFGFLEEYEAEYEQALKEFRRLRNDLDEKVLPQ